MAARRTTNMTAKKATKKTRKPPRKETNMATGDRRQSEYSALVEAGQFLITAYEQRIAEAKVYAHDDSPVGYFSRGRISAYETIIDTLNVWVGK